MAISTIRQRPACDGGRTPRGFLWGLSRRLARGLLWSLLWSLLCWLSGLAGPAGGSALWAQGIGGAGSEVAAETNAAQALELESKDQFSQAIKVWRQILQDSPNSSQAYYGLGRSYLRLGRYQEALRSVQQARLLANSDVRIDVLKSRILMGLGRYDEAEALLLDLKQRDSSYPIDLTLAEISAITGDLTRSIDFLRAIQSFAEEQLDFLLVATMIYEEAGELEQAQDYLRRSLEGYYNQAAVHKVAAGFYLRRSNYQRVLEEIDLIHRLGIDTQELRTLALEVAYLKGDYQLAINLGRDLVQLYPHAAAAWYLLGLCYNRNSQDTEALEALDTARRIQPQNERASIVIQELLRTQYPYPSAQHTEEAGRYRARAAPRRAALLYDEAQQELRFALQLDPLNEQNWMAFAQVFRDRGNYGKYLDKLYAWKKYGLRAQASKQGSSVAKNPENSADGAVNRQLERLIALYEASQSQGVAQRWGLAQYSYSNDFYPLQVFLLRGNSQEYSGISQQLGSYFANILEWREQPRVVGQVQQIDDRLEAQKITQDSNASDYYLILELTNQGKGQALRAELGLYLSATGRQIATLKAEQISQGRIFATFSRLAEELASLFPKRTRIVGTAFDQGVLSMGSLDGVQPGQEWLLLRAVRPSADKPLIAYSPDQLLGHLVIGEVDEKLSEGQIQLQSPIAPAQEGDWAILLPAEVEELEQPAASAAPQPDASPQTGFFNWAWSLLQPPTTEISPENTPQLTSTGLQPNADLQARFFQLW